jgi:hypothetical protein
VLYYILLSVITNGTKIIPTNDIVVEHAHYDSNNWATIDDFQNVNKLTYCRCFRKLIVLVPRDNFSRNKYRPRLAGVHTNK